MAANTLSILKPSVNNRTAVESALGAAYSEPAQDVRDYIAYVRSQ